MRRRAFITLLGGAAAWPLPARGQQGGRVRRIGTLTGIGDEPTMQARIAAFRQGLQELGWSDGGNLQIDYRWGEGDAEKTRKAAAELAALAPDVILAIGYPATERLIQATHTVPIVFVIVPDPVGSGFVDSLSRPGGNVTGFMQFEYSLSGKWLELLKEIAPGITRAGVLWDPAIAAGIGQFAIIQSVAASFGIELSPVYVRDSSSIERGVSAFARFPHGGLIVTASASTIFHRDLIVALAAEHKLPAVYNTRDFVTLGGLISYGANYTDQFRRAAVYVDRILRGQQPAELPVQAPTKYELVINLKTANALGLDVPTTLLARADEVIE